MTPRERLLDRIDSLRDEAVCDSPDGDRVNDLLAGIRVCFAACGAAHRTKPPQPGVSAGSLVDAWGIYGR